MSSRRITSLMRDRIIAALIKHKFDEEKQEHERRTNEIARNIYSDVFAVDYQEFMGTLPDGWLPKSSYLHATIGGSYESLCLGAEFSFPYSKYNGCLAVYEGDHPIGVAWVQLAGDKESLRRKVKEAKAAASAILESVTMTGALVAKWPEVAPFLPPESLPEMLPSIPIESINKLLGLEPVNLAVAS